jgi:UDP-2,3-diacylglucosamine pyrophosphatase LpxH
MSKKYAVVVSDVHIGNGRPTVWYQKSVHESYLEKILDYVIEKKDDIRELVLLGDIVDFWTYPPNVQPPKISDIIADNPKILGPNGKLAAAVKALGGAVTYVRGNHDAGVTQADINALAGEPIKLGDHIHTLTDSEGKRKTIFSHGHLWTMFNAPDLKSKKSQEWNSLPVGHFVTRAFAYQMDKELKPGQTVADLPNQGAPNGFDLLTFLESLKFDEKPNVAQLLLKYCSKRAKLDEREQIILSNGSKTCLAEAEDVYSNLFSQWVASEGSARAAGRAAMADQWCEYLAWYAQRLALQTGSDLVVLGHTHTPVGGLSPSPVNYINSGFECPSKPDLQNKKTMPTFAVVDLETATPEVYQVRKSGDAYIIEPANAVIQSPIPPPAMDYSCHVLIENRTSGPLELQNYTASDGKWVVVPLQTIPAGTTAQCWLQDYLGAEGSAGTLSYKVLGHQADLSVECPTGTQPNKVSSPPPVEVMTRIGAGEWRPGPPSPLGHPLQVRFVIPARGVTPITVPFDIKEHGKESGRAVATKGPLYLGDQVEINGSVKLQDIIVGKKNACVYEVTLGPAHVSAFYKYAVDVDAQGPKGVDSGTMYLYFTDQTGKPNGQYTLSIFDSKRKSHYVDYNSNQPGIVEIEWK